MKKIIFLTLLACLVVFNQACQTQNSEEMELINQTERFNRIKEQAYERFASELGEYISSPEMIYYNMTRSGDADLLENFPYEEVWNSFSTPFQEYSSGYVSDATLDGTGTIETYYEEQIIRDYQLSQYEKDLFAEVFAGFEYIQDTDDFPWTPLIEGLQLNACESAYNQAILEARILSLVLMAAGHGGPALYGYIVNVSRALDDYNRCKLGNKGGGTSGSKPAPGTGGHPGGGGK